MHSSLELRSSSFEIRVAGRAVRLVELFDGFGEHDRLGIVIRRPCSGVGASALITATITAFYDLHRARGPDFFVYPDYLLFHVGRPHGDRARLDIWPSRKEVVVPEDPEQILEAIDDRAITRLVVEDGEPGEPDFEPEALASARGEVAREERRRIKRARKELVEGGAPVETYRRSPLTRRSVCSRRSQPL
jgi:hypothetical protein